MSGSLITITGNEFLFFCHFINLFKLVFASSK